MDPAPKIEFDAEGFMADPALWNDDVALLLARDEGIAEMTERHWAIVRFIRGYWKEHDLAPPVRLICTEPEVERPRHLQALPSGPARGACRMAGLPKPDGCV